MDARDLAIRRIAAQCARFPELEIGPLETPPEMDQRDAALAAAIDHAVRSRWLTLETVVQAQLSRPWDDLESKMQAVLLAGAAQLLLLERLPDHAVLHESVEWAKRRIRPKSGAMVNAVLRKIAGLRAQPCVLSDPRSAGRDQLPLDDGRAWQLGQPVFDAGMVRRVAQQTSHIEPLIAHWLAALGEQHMLALACHSLVHPPIVLHGIDQSADPALLPHHQAGFFVFEGGRARLADLLAQRPQAIVQDPTAAVPALATRDLNPAPRIIIDVCAGRGTKTRQLARLHPNASIIATDINPERFESLRKQFEGLEQVRVIAHEDLRQFDEQADLLLLDVPCSNSGVLARRVEAKYRYSLKSMQSVIDLQRQIIANSIPLLAPRGRVLYSTCSIEPAENQAQAQWIAKWHQMKVAFNATQMPEGLPGQPSSGYRDGGYFALLERA